MTTTTTTELVFVKLGGSLITDKRRRETPRPRLLRRLAEEIRAALDAAPHLRLLLGHGSGSFGHWEASRHGTRRGVRTPDQWHGFARVSASALRLNRIVVDTFVQVGVPVLSLQPAASALADDGHIVAYDDAPIRAALTHGLVPLIFGDVAFDRTRGGTILSTEDLFVHLAAPLRPRRILLLGNTPGVLDEAGQVIPTITPATYADVAACLRGSHYTDVTGGMADKVQQMIALVTRQPALRIWILTGREPDVLRRALLAPETTPGTCITGGEA